MTQSSYRNETNQYDTIFIQKWNKSIWHNLHTEMKQINMIQSSYRNGSCKFWNVDRIILFMKNHQDNCVSLINILISLSYIEPEQKWQQ
jgi:hypothetical protein